jgi:hypothetical protein
MNTFNFFLHDEGPNVYILNAGVRETLVSPSERSDFGGITSAINDFQVYI